MIPNKSTTITPLHASGEEEGKKKRKAYTHPRAFVVFSTRASEPVLTPRIPPSWRKLDLTDSVTHTRTHLQACTIQVRTLLIIGVPIRGLQQGRSHGRTSLLRISTQSILAVAVVVVPARPGHHPPCWLIELAARAQEHEGVVFKMIIGSLLFWAKIIPIHQAINTNERLPTTHATLTLG